MLPRRITSKTSPNLSFISRRHWSVRLAGVTMSARSHNPRSLSSFRSRPAMMVFPAPGSSASRKRTLAFGSKYLIDRLQLVWERVYL